MRSWGRLVGRCRGRFRSGGACSGDVLGCLEEGLRRGSCQ
jgi:hypothetical protein